MIIPSVSSMPANFTAPYIGRPPQLRPLYLGTSHSAYIHQLACTTSVAALTVFRDLHRVDQVLRLGDPADVVPSGPVGFHVHVLGPPQRLRLRPSEGNATYSRKFGLHGSQNGPLSLLEGAIDSQSLHARTSRRMVHSGVFFLRYRCGADKPGARTRHTLINVCRAPSAK